MVLRYAWLRMMPGRVYCGTMILVGWIRMMDEWVYCGTMIWVDYNDG